MRRKFLIHWNWRLGLGLLLLAWATSVALADPKRVLILHSFGRDFAPFDTMSSTFRTELARQSLEPVEFYEASIETARFAAVGNDDQLMGYLRTLFAGRPLDLIFTVAEPATFFCIRHRAEFFPDTPLLAHVDHRQIPIVTATTNATIVPVYIKIPVLVENILQVLPDTTNVMMVLGASPFERVWTGLCREGFAAFTNRVNFTYVNDLPLDVIRERVGSLPPRSAVLYGMLAMDAAGVPYEQEKALASLRAAANAPVFGVFESQMGHGIVGGPLISLEDSGREAARTGLRLLRGEHPRAISIPPPEPVPFVYDWRELQRWNISAGRLPAGCAVRFRVPTFWEQYKWQLIGLHAVCLAEGILIFLLLRNRRRLRRAQAELLHSEERLSLATSSAKVGVWAWNIQSGEIEATAECKQMFGFALNEPVNFNRFLQRVHPDDRAAVQKAVDEATRDKTIYDVQYRIVLPDGQVRWIAARGRGNYRNVSPGHMLGVVLDITDQKRADAKFRLAVESSPNAFVMVDQRGQIVLVNSQTEKAFGYTRAELVGQPVELLLPERYRGEHPAHRQEFFAAPEIRAMGAGRELFARRKDGSEFPVEIGLNPIQAEEGAFVLAAIIDISERRKTEQEMQRHRQELAHISRVSIMGELSASMAHELNQPLTAILTNAQAGQRFLATGQADLMEYREILKDIAHDTTRARDVIRHLRALVKRSEPDFTRLDVGDTIREVVGFLHGDIVARNVRVGLELTPDLPAVHGDRIQLQQVMINLLLNAFDALNDNPVPERLVTVATVLESPKLIRVTVRDSGVGIPPDKLDSIFEPFFTTKRDGMGMGLSVTRSIVEVHGGRIRAENNPERGAVFHFTLPVAEPA